MANHANLFSISLQANSIWLYIVPRGMRSLMNYIKQKYRNPTVIITENGDLFFLFPTITIYFI